MYQEMVRVGIKARVGGWLCGMCSVSSIRIINHTLGPYDLKEGWKISPGHVTDSFHAWMKCIVGPGRDQKLDSRIVDQHEEMCIVAGDIESNTWNEEESIFDDEDEFLAIVEDFETKFDEDDALLVAC